MTDEIDDAAQQRSDEELVWRCVASQAGPELKLFGVRLDEMEHPRSHEVMQRLVLTSVDWVNVVAVTDRGAVVMVRQYRFGAGYTTLETPGGMVDPGEEPLAAAQRELAEETGYTGGDWSYLGAVEPNPAFHDHLCHHYLARNVLHTQQQQMGAGELIRVELMSEQLVRRAVLDGTIRHSLALSALSRVYELWSRPYSQPQSEPLRRRTNRTGH